MTYEERVRGIYSNIKVDKKRWNSQNRYRWTFRDAGLLLGSYFSWEIMEPEIWEKLWISVQSGLAYKEKVLAIYPGAHCEYNRLTYDWNIWVESRPGLILAFGWDPTKEDLWKAAWEKTQDLLLERLSS